MSKVAYLAPYFWPEVIGSAPYCTDFARWLVQHGHEVEVLTCRPHYPSPDTFPEWADGSRDSERHEGIHITRCSVDGRGGGGFLSRLWNDLHYGVSALLAAGRSTYAGADAVVAYVPSCLALFGAAVLSWRTGARLTVVVHDIESGLAESLGMARHPFLLWAMRRVEQFAFNRADHVVVLSEAMRTELVQHGCRRPVSVLPIWASPFPKRPIRESDPKVVCYSGNFGKKQNIDQLVPLITKLNERNRTVRVLLRGDGTELPRIKELLASRHVTNVTMLPLAPQEKFAEALQEAQIHLVPQAENTASYAVPSKVFSIMAAGRPFVCIAQKDSPLDVLARDTGAGVCVQAHDEEALFDAVQRLISDPATCDAMGRRGYAYVEEHMSRSRIMEQYERIVFDQGPAAESKPVGEPAAAALPSR